MSWYNPYFTNHVHPSSIQQHQVPPYPQTSSGKVSRSVEPPLEPEAHDDGRIVDCTKFFFSGHQFFEKRLLMRGCGVNSNSGVFVSITEVDGNNKPFQGAASMEVFNVVPHDDGTVIVRGRIWWDSDIRVRLSVFRA
ncbi:hypothetical protein S101359_03240 [Bacillus atrophaeus]|nr:hypothetical protein S101359_03240 [Bacillus atrophaeus]